jgi:hypothetical protein
MPELTEDMKFSTLLESVKKSLFRAVRYNRSDMVGPVVILWTDSDNQWAVLVEQLRPLMPELFTLGEYNPEKWVGPAIWLRCIIERFLPDIDLGIGVGPRCGNWGRATVKPWYLRINVKNNPDIWA